MTTVSEYSKSGGEVPPHMIYFYRSMSPLNPARCQHNKSVLRACSDMRWPRFAHCAQGLDYALEERNKILEIQHQGQSPCARVRKILRQRVERKATVGLRSWWACRNAWSTRRSAGNGCPIATPGAVLRADS